MRNVSSNFIEASLSPVGYANAYIEIGDTRIDASNITDITITSDLGGSYTIGSFNTAEASMTVVSEALPNVVTAVPIKIYFGYYIASTGDFEYVPMGVFYAEPRDVSHKNLLTTIRAHDKSWSFTDKYVTALDFTGTVYVLDVLNEIQTALGLTMGSNGGLNPGYVRVYDAPEGSYRDVIAQMALLIGTNAKLNRSGALDFIKVDTSATPVQEYGAYDYASDNYQLSSDEPSVLGKLTANYTHEVQNGDEVEEVTDTFVYGSGDHGLTLDTTNIRTQGEADTLGQTVIGSGVSYYGYSATLLGQPQIDLGDVITITEPLGDEYNFIVLSASHNFNGAMKSTFSATISDTDPAVEGNNISGSLTEEVEKMSSKVGSQGRRLKAVENIAGNTNQYFWFTSTGQDTGAHITQVPQETFVANPSQGGGNLLARSNGVAVRNGLTELGVFAANYVRLGQANSTRVLLQSGTYNGLEVFDETNTSVAWFGASSRIGASDDGHINLYPTGVEIFKKTTDDASPVSVAYFGSESRIGASSGKNVHIGTQINFRDNGTNIGYLAGNSARIGAVDQEGNIVINTTDGFSVYNSGQTKAYLRANSTMVRLGTADSLYTRIAPAQIDFYDGSGSTPVSLVRFTPNAFRLGAEGGARILVQRGTYNGLEVFDENNTSVAWFGSTARIGASDSGRVTIASDSIQMYRKTSDDASPVSIAYFGMYNNKGWARIGALSENHINVDGTYNGIEIFRKLDTDASPVSVAWFGSSVRLGASDDARVIINPSYFNIYNSQNDNTFSIGLASASDSYYRYIYSSYLSSGTSVEISLPSIATGTVVNVSIELTGGAITAESFTIGTATTQSDISYDGNRTLTITSRGATYSVYYTVDANPPMWTLGSRLGTRGGFSAVIGMGKATALYSLSCGRMTEATAVGAFAQGSYCKASNTNAFAQGQNSRATAIAQAVFGKNNKTDSTKAFIIGNGTGRDLDENRYDNALTVDWDGNLDISGAFKSLFKVTTTTYSVPAGSAGYVSVGTKTLEDQVSGYMPVAIVGFTKQSTNVEIVDNYISSSTQMYANFRRLATTTSAYNVVFRVLWLKATSA